MLNFETYESDEQLVQSIVDHRDDINEIIIPVPREFVLGNGTFRDAGAVVWTCNNRYHAIGVAPAQLLLNSPAIRNLHLLPVRLQVLKPQ